MQKIARYCLTSTFKYIVIQMRKLTVKRATRHAREHALPKNILGSARVAGLRLHRVAKCQQVAFASFEFFLNLNNLTEW